MGHFKAPRFLKHLIDSGFTLGIYDSHISKSLKVGCLANLPLSEVQVPI